jgi:hypothetical protein
MAMAMDNLFVLEDDERLEWRERERGKSVALSLRYEISLNGV